MDYISAGNIMGDGDISAGNIMGDGDISAGNIMGDGDISALFHNWLRHNQDYLNIFIDHIYGDSMPDRIPKLS